MGRDFCYYWKNPNEEFCDRDEDGFSIDPERFYLDMSISRHNDFISGYGGHYTHYTPDTLKKQIEDLTKKIEEVKKSDLWELMEAIKVFYALLAEMVCGQKSDIWIHYN